MSTASHLAGGKDPDGERAPAKNQWNTGWAYLAGLIILVIGVRLLSMALDLRLDNDQYSQPNLLTESLVHWRQLLVVAIATAIIFAAGNRGGWSGIEQPAVIRFFIVSQCVAIAWAFSAYAMNHFYGQLHLASRVTLIGLVILVYFHPAALPVFITTAYMVAHQFEGDLPGSYSWNDKRIVFQTLTLFSVYQIWTLITRQGITLFLTACLSLISANYFQAGYNKIALPGWLAGNDLVNFFFAAHVNGWSIFPDNETAVNTLNTLRPANILMVAGTLLIELVLQSHLPKNADNSTTRSLGERIWHGSRASKRSGNGGSNWIV